MFFCQLWFVIATAKWSNVSSPLCLWMPQFAVTHQHNLEQTLQQCILRMCSQKVSLWDLVSKVAESLQSLLRFTGTHVNEQLDRNNYGFTENQLCVNGVWEAQHGQVKVKQWTSNQVVARHEGMTLQHYIKFKKLILHNIFA